MSSFRAGGLASGLDSNSIVDQLVRLEARPIDLLRKRQAAMRTQVSVLGDIVSRLGELKNAARALAEGGVLGVRASSGHTGFTAVPGSGAVAGRYDITVGRLASAALARSSAFLSADAPVRGGTLDITVMGESFNVNITDGMALSDVALAIRDSGAPVNAVVLSNGTNHYLSITNRDTGYPIGGDPEDALRIVENTTGGTGQALGAGVVQDAENASFTVNGLTFTRRSNTVTDAVPGTTLTLRAVTGSVESLILDNDVEETARGLQRFIDAYNGAMRLVARQLDIQPNTDRASSLGGDGAVRHLQARLQKLIVAEVGAGDVRTLADIGVKSGRDGSLSLDRTTLASAIARDGSAVNRIFSENATGLGALTTTLVDQNVNSVDGLLTTRRKGLGDSIRRLEDQVANLELRLETFRRRLINQFTAMERVVSGLRSTGNFLSQQTLYTGGTR